MPMTAIERKECERAHTCGIERSAGVDRRVIFLKGRSVNMHICSGIEWFIYYNVTVSMLISSLFLFY